MNKSETALSILLVDDDKVDRMAAKRLLESSGLEAEVEEADRTSRALEALKRRRFDCVLLDYHLPDGDALGILRRLKDPSIPSPPLVILTARGSETVAVQLLKAGAADYLPKTELTASRIAQSIRNAVRVRKAEEALHRSYAELEQRVIDRTRELEEANRRLESEMAERREAEERARRHLEELAHVDRVSTLGELAASLAHELHQPLGAIVNFGHGCQGDIAAGGCDLESVSKVLEKMIAQAERAAEILRRQRSFAARREARKEAADLNALVLEISELARLGIGSGDARFEFELAEDLPAVPVDRIAIQQVLMNLMKNGVEAMRECPPSERRLSVSTRRTGAGDVEVAVSDCGCGFSPENLERLFESFFTTKEEGTGLGLAICRSIVEAHGGRLSAERNSGPGLTLRFVLPVASSEIRDGDAEAERGNPHE